MGWKYKYENHYMNKMTKHTQREAEILNEWLYDYVAAVSKVDTDWIRGEISKRESDKRKEDIANTYKGYMGNVLNFTRK